MNIFNGEEFYETQGVITISEQMKELDLNQDEWCINFGGVGVASNDTKPKEKHELTVSSESKYGFSFTVNGDSDIHSAYKGDTIKVTTDVIKDLEIAPKFVIFYNNTSKEIPLKEEILPYPERPRTKVYVYEFKMVDYDVEMLCNDTGEKKAYEITKDNGSEYNFKTDPSSEASEGDMVTVTTDPIEGERPTGDEPEVTVTETTSQEKQKATFVEKRAVENGGGKGPVVSYEYVYVFLMPASDVEVNVSEASDKYNISKDGNLKTEPVDKAKSGSIVNVTTDPIEGERGEGEEPEVTVTETEGGVPGESKKAAYVEKHLVENGGGAKAGEEVYYEYIYAFEMPASDVNVTMTDSQSGKHDISKKGNSEYDFTTQPKTKAGEGETVMVTTDPIEGDRTEGEEPDVTVTETSGSGTGTEKKGTYVGKYKEEKTSNDGGGAKAGNMKAEEENRWIYVYVFDMPDSDVEVGVYDVEVGG